jgi:hypothetical protein
MSRISICHNVSSPTRLPFALSDFLGEEPPKTCGHADDGKDRVCCKKDTTRMRKVPEKKYG